MSAVSAEIDWYPLELVAKTLGYSRATIRRWAAELRRADIPEFDHEPYEETVTAQSMQIYRRIAELRDKKVSVLKAIKNIEIYGV